MKTDKSRTFRPVKITVAGRTRELKTVLDVAKLHTGNDWPLQNGPAQSKVRLAMVEALNDEKSPEEVRQALLRAAREAYLKYDA
ncbi:DUF982 domain-containing protein [Rhizobium sp. BR 362]|uniref:DUF982 domain-containing protein n=1 Tax=Rhizobium sp. BR 362 TaxID=3040670 RepID=UPI002F3EA82E